MTHSRYDKIIVALDVEEFGHAEKLVLQLQEYVRTFKIGKQLFTRCGPDVVRMVTAAGGRVFLDLKFHDIPTTVAKASREAVRLGVFMFNMHALGGLEMMRKAAAEARSMAASLGCTPPALLAVTVLTSLGTEDLRRVGMPSRMDDLVKRLAGLAREAGLDGVVASPREIALIKQECGQDFLVVTPGIRPAATSRDDQKRTMTPQEALDAGADYLVIGRPVTAATDPAEAVRQIASGLL